MSGNITWRKSSYSNGSGECVEVGVFADGTIGVRDSKANGVGPMLQFSVPEWAAFLAGARDGEFD